MSIQYATFVLYAQEVLRLDARGFGLLSTATAAGAVLGGQLAPAISRRIGQRAALLLAVAGLAPAYATVGLSDSGALVAAAGALAGRELGLRAPFLLTAAAMVALLAVAALLVTAARTEAATPTP